jgi:hypothetical protein
MTEEQYDNAEMDLIERLQSMRESECGARALVSKSTGTEDDGHDENDDVYETPVSTEHQESFNEWRSYCGLVKRFRNFPRRYKRDQNYVSIGQIEFGVVEEAGDDIEALPGSLFKTCNLASFMIDGGYFDIIGFLTFNKEAFPFIFKLGCCLASLRTNEVGCERFFSIAGYVSNPRRARLKVKHYETIAMLKRNMQQVYIDEDFVLSEYMEIDKVKSWSKEQTASDEVVTCFESKIYAEDLGIVVGELPMEFIDGEPDDCISISDSDSSSSNSD